jgi:FkbM family methyltransferase
MNIYNNRIIRYLTYRLLFRHPRFRLLITRLLLRDKDVDIELFGSKLKINQVKELGYKRAAQTANSNNVFRDEAPVLINLALMLLPGDTFVDVGANVGLYSAVLGRLGRVYAQNRWYAFEPNKDTAHRLAENTSDLRVEIIEKGASSKTGERSFLAGATSGVFGVKENASHFQFGQPVLIPMTTLDETKILGDRIVLKIDAEGHEIEVLQGGENLIRSGRVRVIYIDGYSDRTIPDWLLAKGFRTFDGRTLTESIAPEHSLLAIRTDE